MSTAARAGQAGAPEPPAARPRIRARRSDAERNRRALLAAARAIFERDGFVRSRIVDIADEAGVAHGCFYSHFPGKQEIFAAVLAEVSDEMLHPGPALSGSGGSDPVAAIEAANLAYLEAYQRNARFMAVLEQVATVDDAFRQLRLERSQAFLARNTRAIRRLQRAGLADPGLDPELAALALSTMVSRSAYAAFVLGHPAADPARLAATVTRLWVSGLRLAV